MRRPSFFSPGFSLAALFAASLVAAAGCASLASLSSADSGTLGAGGGIVLPGTGGNGGYGSTTGTGGNSIPPYLMGSYAYLCGGDQATCVPGKGVCSLIDPTKNDGGIGGDTTAAGSSGTSGAGGGDPSGSSSSSSGAGGSGASSSSGVGGGAGSSGSGSSGVGGSTGGVGGGTSSGVGGAGGSSSGSTASSSGVGGSSGVGTSSGVGGSSGAGTGSGAGGSGASSSAAGGGGGDAGAPTFTCKLSPVGDKALAQCTAAGDQSSGDPCQSSADCGVGLACIATLSGGLCRPYCCGQVEECPKDTYCAPTPMAEGNINVPVCLPAHNCKLLEDATCTNGQTCTIVRDDGTTSCVEPGTGARGEACPCSPGEICSKFTNTCLKLCHIGNDAADCGAGSCQGGVMAYPEGIGICVGYP